MKEVTLTISSKGQITLPKSARVKLGLHAGSRLVLKRVGREELVLATRKRPEQYFGVLAGMWSEGGQTPESYVRELRDQDE